MMATRYRVELDIYCGPLDLLLYLVRRNEVDIRDLPIARITAQFLEYLEVLELLDFDTIGDFVVMASTLVEIKSRLVLPQPPVEPEEDVPLSDDPRSDLVRRLLQYKRFKDAARELEERAVAWRERFPRLCEERPSVSAGAAADRIRDVELWDLVSALGRVLSRRQFSGEASIRYDDTPISVYAERISRRVRREQRVAFSSLFDGATDRSVVIGMFLAVLELLRHHGFRAVQGEDFGEIWILARSTPWPRPMPLGLPAPAEESPLSPAQESPPASAASAPMQQSGDDEAPADVDAGT